MSISFRAYQSGRMSSTTKDFPILRNGDMILILKIKDGATTSCSIILKNDWRMPALVMEYLPSPPVRKIMEAWNILPRGWPAAVKQISYTEGSKYGRNYLAG